MKKHFLFAALAGLMTFAACDSEETVVPEPPQQEEDKEIVNGPKEEDIFNAPYTRREDIKLGETQQEINKELNNFAWKMFAQTFENKDKSNLMTSPYSFIQNLLMLSNGVQGETLEEVRAALEIEDFSMEDVNQYILQFNEGMAKADTRTKYRTENGIWYLNSLAMQAYFATNISQYYKAESFPAEMNEKTRTEINEWANERTYGRIPNLVDNLPEGTQSILANTVYFRGLWFKEMDEEDMEDGIFHSEDGQEQKARMVYYPEYTTYAEGETYQVTQRDFGNRTYAMDFILPKEGKTATEVLEEYISELDKERKELSVELTFPCFEAENKMELREVLNTLGINRMFNPLDSRDFQLFNEPSFVSQVIQKASITVNEKGTEAAAGTYSIMVSMGGDSNKNPETVTMTLDRPFFYAIRETSTNTPLFIGYQGSVAK